MTDQNEVRLVKRAKQGDMHAFEELILQHEKIVYNVALRMMNHSEDAKDISQEVFLKAYRNIGNFDERSQFSTWIYRITANTCIDEMRKRKGRQSFSLEEELESEEGSMQRQVADAGETPACFERSRKARFDRHWRAFRRSIRWRLSCGISRGFPTRKSLRFWSLRWER